MKEKQEKDWTKNYYCKVCRMWYPETKELQKIDHLYAHLYFVESLIQEIDFVHVESENEQGGLQSN